MDAVGGANPPEMQALPPPTALGCGQLSGEFNTKWGFEKIKNLECKGSKSDIFSAYFQY